MINAVDPTLTETASESALFDGLGGDAFLQLLVAQLRFQDPLAPTDPASMLEQTSQFANVEAVQKLNDLQTQLLGFTQFQAAASLIGSEVTAEDGDLGPITGLVIGVTATSTGPILRFADGTEVDVQDVIQVDALGAGQLRSDSSPSAGDADGSTNEGTPSS
ncbi:MAG: flagellar hook capping FlgD N-terminal domain-containing protein [Actinomycetota bacterium]